MPAWYDIYQRIAQPDLKGMEKSRQYLKELIEEEIRAGTPASKIFVGGFSQGAVMSLITGYSFDVKLAGVIALSGYLPSPENWVDSLTTESKTTPLLMCHGTMDQVVPFQFGQASFAAIKPHLKEAGFEAYPGMQHTADYPELQKVATFIKTRLE